MSVLPPHVVEALRKGNKIEAIKLLREATKLGLAEAKGVIDRHEDAHAPVGRASISPARHAGAPLHRPGLGPGEEPRASFSGVAIAIALAVAALAAWMYWPPG